jgi:hypothetical protein
MGQNFNAGHGTGSGDGLMVNLMHFPPFPITIQSFLHVLLTANHVKYVVGSRHLLPEFDELVALSESRLPQSPGWQWSPFFGNSSSFNDQEMRACRLVVRPAQ